MLDFFESIGMVCDAHFNPADFICKYCYYMTSSVSGQDEANLVL